MRTTPRTALPSLAVAALFLGLLLAPAVSPAATVYVSKNGYRLDNLVTDNPWDVLEEVMYRKDVAIVVMEKEALLSRVNEIIETLEKMNIPTIFTKKADYDECVRRGVIAPTPPPTK